MKLLFLPAYHYPEKAASLYLGENARAAYAEQGWKMVTYCPVPSRGVDTEVRKKYKRSPNSVELSGALEVHRFSLWREGRNPVFRALRYCVCQGKQYRLAKKEKDVDILFLSSTPPIRGLMMSRLKKKLGCKIVYHLQDIFPDSLVNAGLTRRGSLIWKLGRHIEDVTYRDADRIIVISERFKRNIMEKGVPEDKISVIPNWVDEDAVRPIERCENPLFDRFGFDRNGFYITYCGNLGKTQNIELLAETAELLRGYTDIRLAIFGEGVCAERLRRLITEKQLDNISLLPFMPNEEIGYVFSLGDVGLLISKGGVSTSSVPSKTWSVMGAGRAVIASFDLDSEVGDTLRQAECGACVRPDDPFALRDAILALYNDRALCARLGANGREYISSFLNKKNGCAALVSVIKDVSK